MLNTRLTGIVVTIVSLIWFCFLLYNFEFSLSALGRVSLGNILASLGFFGIGIGAIVLPSDPKKGKIIKIVGRSILGLAVILMFSFVFIKS
jgi:hypothetical protein